MPTRAETAAATRAALLAAAGDLLDDGGPDAVTLRAVGARAGVSRGAPYGHFADKEHLLTHLAARAWLSLADDLRVLQAETWTPTARLERALCALVDQGRQQPHLYRLMFRAPRSGAAELESAVAASHETFLAMVADVIGGRDAREHGALLLATAHGITAMEMSGPCRRRSGASPGTRSSRTPSGR